jgi:hypothetical protein
MTRGPNDGENFLEASYSGGAGDRTGILGATEPADLLAIYNKIFGSADDQPSKQPEEAASASEVASATDNVTT